MSIGFEIPDLVANLDEKKAEAVARKIFEKLQAEVKKHITSAWIKNQQQVVWVSHRIHGKIDLKKVRTLTQRCIQKRAWSILHPLIENTVLEIFIKEFETQAKSKLPDWVLLASEREVTRSLDMLTDLLPTVIGSDIYSESIMFGGTPIQTALGKAAIRLLDRTYSRRDKILVIISDGEFHGGEEVTLISAELLKQKGVKIVSCLVAEKDILPRVTLSTNRSLPMGAKILHTIASEENGDRFFHQINDSRVLDDIIRVLFERPMQ